MVVRGVERLEGGDVKLILGAVDEAVSAVVAGRVEGCEVGRGKSNVEDQNEGDPVPDGLERAVVEDDTGGNVGTAVGGLLRVFSRLGRLHTRRPRLRSLHLVLRGVVDG